MSSRSLALAGIVALLGGCRCAPKESEPPKPVVPVPITISVESEPTGATVTLDGQAVGVTPFKGPVLPGAHVLRLSKEGFIPHQANLTIAEGRPSQFKASLVQRK